MRATLELLASMRFAISLLTVICIASVIGTVLKQHEPLVNYVNQFGPVLGAAVSGAEAQCGLQRLVVFADSGLSGHQHLAVREPPCPQISGRHPQLQGKLREQSLKAFHHRAEADVAGSTEEAAKRIGQQLVSGGWKVKMQQRDTAAGPGTGWMLAAKAGRPTSWAISPRIARSC
jgi:cytochrome c biogenesis protein